MIDPGGAGGRLNCGTAAAGVGAAGAAGAGAGGGAGVVDVIVHRGPVGSVNVVCAHGAGCCLDPVPITTVALPAASTCISTPFGAR